MNTPVIDSATVAALVKPVNFLLSEEESAALGRLLDIAKRDTGQSRRVADFLLSWWNAGTCGAFDLTTLWAVDDQVATDMAAVFALVARVHRYPDTLGYEDDFKAVIKAWRPELAD